MLGAAAQRIQWLFLKSITRGYRRENLCLDEGRPPARLAPTSPPGCDHTDMEQGSAEYQYVTGQGRDSFPSLLAGFATRSDAARALSGWRLEIPYGPHPRQVLDLKAAGADARGTVVYFHAGYWQSRDKSQFPFLAPAFNAMGWNLALVNYPLCPEVGVAQIVESAAQALARVAAMQADGELAGPLVLCGHSAGAHLAVELALRQAAAGAGGPRRIRGVIGISGVYDLRPLCGTSLNQRLRLDADTAQACSPLLRARPGAAPALFVAGGDETRAFQDQNAAMSRQWEASGNPARCVTVAGADHFSILDEITAAGGLLEAALQAWSSPAP